VLLYHGILAPHAAGRAAAVAYVRPRPGERLHEQASEESAALTPVSRPTVGATVLEPNATPLGMTLLWHPARRSPRRRGRFRNRQQHSCPQP